MRNEFVRLCMAMRTPEKTLGQGLAKILFYDDGAQRCPTLKTPASTTKGKEQPTLFLLNVIKATQLHTDST